MRRILMAVAALLVLAVVLVVYGLIEEPSSAGDVFSHSHWLLF